MIYTITLNPSIDYIVKIDNLLIGNLNRIDESHMYPGGKGINVSRVLANLGVKSRALGFLGGNCGNFIRDFLRKEGIEDLFIKIDDETRINVKLKSGVETELNASGPKISKDKFLELMDQIDKIENDSFLILAGNVQNTLPKDIYLQIQNKVKSKNIKVILDTTKDFILDGLKEKPFLIKPNKHELEEIFETEIKTDEEIIYWAKELQSLGAQNVIVSMGKDGSIMVTKDKAFKASVIKGELKNSVGAGDSMVAGFSYSYQKDQDFKEAFKWAAACGSATAFSMDLCTKKEVLKVYEEISIFEL